MASSERAVSDAVLEAVAKREGIAVDDLERQLYYVIDPEALDALFRDGPGRITFPYHDYVVTVDDDHDVEIAPAEEG